MACPKKLSTRACIIRFCMVQMSVQMNRQPEPLNISTFRANVRKYLALAKDGKPQRIMRHAETLAILVGAKDFQKMMAVMERKRVR